MGATIFVSGTDNGAGCTYNIFVDATDLVVDPNTSRYEGPVSLAIDRDCGGVTCSTVYSCAGLQS